MTSDDQTPKAAREWTAVEVFECINTGNDVGLPDSFVDSKNYDALTAENAKLRADLAFYASALDVKSEHNFGEPNEEPGLLPVPLGTRAKKALERE